MLVRLKHPVVAVAQHVLDHPVLVRLEARGLAQLGAEGGVVRRRHGAQHVPGVVELLEDAGNAGEALERLAQPVPPDGVPRRGEFVDGELHPELADLVLDDEQHLVMRRGAGVLRRQHRVEREVVAIGHCVGEVGESTVLVAARIFAMHGAA